jgi:hypothetical protein
MHFTSWSYKHKGGKNPYAIGSLEIFNSSQPYPRFPPMDLMVAAYSPAARWSTGWQTSNPDARFHSPRVCWPRLEGRGCSGERARRRPTAAVAAARTPAKLGTGLPNAWLG